MSNAETMSPGTRHFLYYLSGILAGGLLFVIYVWLTQVTQQQQPVPDSIITDKNEDILVYLFRRIHSTEYNERNVINGTISPKFSSYQLRNLTTPNRTIWNAPGQFFFHRSKKQEDKLNLEAPKLKRVCYYTLPTSNSSDELQPEALDPFLCTHLILFVGNAIVNDTIQLFNATLTTKDIARTLALKTVNTELKILMSLTQGFSELVANSTAVRSFAFNARLFVEQHGLDGLDLDWEFPAWSLDPVHGEKGRFVDLVDKLSTALRLVQPAYLVTAAITGILPVMDHSYDIPGLARNVDFLSLMAYDYHMFQWYLPFTGHNAPLRAHPDTRGYLATLNVEWSVRALLQRGLSKDQLVVGVPTYGRTWRLLSSNWQGVAAPALGPGFGDGYVAYPGAEEVRVSADLALLDTAARVPYAARGLDWVTYESPESAAEKAAWIKASGLAGVMTFNLNNDDWSPEPGREKFPIHAAIRRVLDNSTSDLPERMVHSDWQGTQQRGGDDRGSGATREQLQDSMLRKR